MAQIESTSIQEQFQAFAKQSHLDVIVPRSVDVGAVSALEKSAEEFQRVPSRQHLFFDEKVTVQVILHSEGPQDAVRDLLSDLILSISAHATNAVAESGGNAASISGKFDIATFELSGTEYINLTQRGGVVYAIWQHSIHLLRPRTRLQRPAIYFTATLSPSAEILARAKGEKKRYLQSYESLPSNAFEPLNFDPTHNRREIFLSETKTTKVAPSPPQSDDSIRPLRGATKRAFATVPAVFARITCCSVAGGLIVSLHMEVAQLLAGEVTFNRIEFDVPGVLVKTLSIPSPLQSSRAGDEITALFQLRVDTRYHTSHATRAASVTINAVAFLEQGTEVKLDLLWPTQIDMSLFKSTSEVGWTQPTAEPLPNHLEVLSQQNARPVTSHIPGRPLAGSKIIFTFEAQPTAWRGSEFTLNVHCVNHSAQQRTFVLIPSKAKPSTHNTSKANMQTEHGNLGTKKDDRTQLSNSFMSSVLVITPYVRIGPLEPGTCFETSVAFKAISGGVLDLGVLRILDLDSRQTLDVTESPHVVAIEPVEEQ